jgi:hypothetical protein
MLWGLKLRGAGRNPPVVFVHQKDLKRDPLWTVCPHVTHSWVAMEAAGFSVLWKVLEAVRHGTKIASVRGLSRFHPDWVHA